MDVLNSITNELQMDYVQFLTVAFGVAFLTGPLVLNLTTKIPFIKDLDLVYQQGILAGIYAIVGNWFSRTYSRS